MYQLPVGEGIRVDNGFEQGYSIYYDRCSLNGETREEAIKL
jgi:propionyl-CoA carboxylase alpha chain